MDLTNLPGHEFLEQRKQSTASSCTLINGNLAKHTSDVGIDLAELGELLIAFKIHKFPVSIVASCKHAKTLLF
jgi:hypothetical protein